MPQRFFNDGKIDVGENIGSGNLQTTVVTGFTAPAYHGHLIEDTLFINTTQEIVSFDLKKNKKNWSVSASRLAGKGGAMADQFIVANGRLLCHALVGPYTNRLYILNIKTGKLLKTIEADHLTHITLLDDSIIGFNRNIPALLRWDARSGVLLDMVKTEIVFERNCNFITHHDVLIVYSKQAIYLYQILEDYLSLMAGFEFENDNTKIAKVKLCGNRLLVLMGQCEKNDSDLYIFDAERLKLKANYQCDKDVMIKPWHWTQQTDCVLVGKYMLAIDAQGVLIKFDLTNNKHKLLAKFGDGHYTLNYCNGLLMIANEDKIWLYDVEKEKVSNLCQSNVAGVRLFQSGKLYYAHKLAVVIHDFTAREPQNQPLVASYTKT